MAAETSAQSKAEERTAAASVFPRHEQTFPTLTSQEIGRMRRFGELRHYKDGESSVRDRQTGTGNVRPAVRPCRDHPARRPRPRHADHRSGTRTVSGRNRPALGPCRAGRWPCRRRRRNAADSAGAAARAVGGGSRSRRAHHARLDPSPGQPDPRRRRRAGADRPVEFARRDSPAGLSHPQRLSASSARSGQRSRCRRTDCALFAVADRLAAGGDRRRYRAAQPERIRTGARDGHGARRRQGQGLRCRRRRQRSGGVVDRGLCGVGRT